MMNRRTRIARIVFLSIPFTVMLFLASPLAAYADQGRNDHGNGRDNNDDHDHGDHQGDHKDIRCCIADHGNNDFFAFLRKKSRTLKCKETSARKCFRVGGFNIGRGSCDGNPCQVPIATTTTTAPPETTTTTTAPPETTTTTTAPPETTTTTTAPPGTTTTTTAPPGTTTTTTAPPATTTTTTAPPATTTTTTAPPATTTTTTAPPVTTTTTLPGPTCSCAGGTPSRLSFVTTVGSGTCGHLDADGNPNFSQINCGGLYFGGAGVGVPLPAAIPDMGTSLLDVSTCDGTTLTLANTTSAETGSNRNCTSVGCLFGQPLPIPNGSHLGSATSTCVINTVSSDATGSADCNKGSTTGLNLPLSSGLFLTGDTLLPNRCDGGTNLGGNCTPVGSACPGGGTCVNDTGRCANNGNPCTADGDCPSSTCETGACVAGGNAGKGCITDADCPGSTCRTFIEPCPICNPTSLKCNGGPNDGLACTPADTAINGDYPTTHDCPPPPGSSLGTLPIAFLLDSGTQTKTSVDLPGQSNVFCGFCRNKITNAFKNPAVTCTADADCSSVTGFTSCGQRTSGAFTSIDVARTIVAQGSPSGALTTGGAPAPATIVSIFCIPPTFNPLVDSAADLPGPGMTALQGTTQLLP